MAVKKISNENRCKSFWRSKSPQARQIVKREYENIIGIAEHRLPATRTRRMPWMLPHWKQGLLWLNEVMVELGE